VVYHRCLEKEQNATRDTCGGSGRRGPKTKTIKSTIMRIISKQMFIVGVVACGIGIALLWAAKQPGAPAKPSDMATAAEAADQPGAESASARVRPIKARTQHEAAATAALGAEEIQAAVQHAVSAPATFYQAIDALVAPATAFGQKQRIWKQLIDSGKLDLAITEMEQRAKASPATAEIPAALGQAYLQKAGTIKDLREQGILGLKADSTFEAALNLDASNWDARFWKTMAMSYWPPELGKGTEVIEQCLQLVVQQEAQAPQPHFAQTYVMLGEQYKKQGQEQYAQEIWKRGLTLFPGHETLAGKLSSQ